MKTPLRLLAAILPLPGLLLASPRVPPPLAEAVEGAERIVLGVLEEDTREMELPENARWHLRIVSDLYGKGGGTRLPVVWKRDVPRPAIQPGETRIWFLVWDAGRKGWRPEPQDLVPDADQKDAVEALLIERFRRDVATVERHAALEVNEKERPLGEEDLALLRLPGLPHPARAAAREWLKSPRPELRLRGCQLAERLGDRALAADLAARLDDPAVYDWRSCTGAEKRTVGALALEILGTLAGKPFGSADEARDWIKQIPE